MFDAPPIITISRADDEPSPTPTTDIVVMPWMARVTMGEYSVLKERYKTGDRIRVIIDDYIDPDNTSTSILVTGKTKDTAEKYYKTIDFTEGNRRRQVNTKKAQKYIDHFNNNYGEQHAYLKEGPQQVFLFFVDQHLQQMFQVLQLRAIAQQYQAMPCDKKHNM